MTTKSETPDRPTLLAEYRTLLRRNRDPRKGDNERLQTVVEQLGKSADDVTADIHATDEIVRMEVRGAAMSEALLEEAKEASDAHTAHVAETAAIVAARERQESWLIARSLKLQREIQRAREAVPTLSSLRTRFPHLFADDADQAAEQAASTKRQSGAPVIAN